MPPRPSSCFWDDDGRPGEHGPEYEHDGGEGGHAQKDAGSRASERTGDRPEGPRPLRNRGRRGRRRRRQHVGRLDEAVDDATGDTEVLLELCPDADGGGKDVRGNTIGEDGGGGPGPFVTALCGGRSPDRLLLPVAVEDASGLSLV
jgi:hypothetical protein